jgi:hypothetical protein
MKRLALSILTIFFLYAAYLQLNDPHPTIWISIYGFAALFTLSAIFRKESGLMRKCVALYGMFALVAATLLIIRSGQSAVTKLLEVEEGREGSGLLIVALAMLLCYISSSQPVGPSSKSPPQHQHNLGNVLSLMSLLVGTLAIAGALWLPQYYNSIGVPLPQHCGGKGQ